MPQINWLTTHKLPGDIVLQSWLLEHGNSYSLTQRYAQSGWLKRLNSGVFIRPGAAPDMQPDGDPPGVGVTKLPRRLYA